MRSAFPVTLARLRWVGLVVALACVPGVAATSGQRTGSRPGSRVERDLVTRTDAQKMREKVSAIEERANLLAAPKGRGAIPSSLATLVTEQEVNSYLAFEAGSQIPVGIAAPRISILGDRRLAGTALVDLDAVRMQHKATGWLDPMSYLSGQLPVTVSGRLSTTAGMARFELESASISNIPIPKTLVQELVSYYSRTPANPRGLNLDDPFPLPARIRQIDVRRGEAVVVQ